MAEKDRMRTKEVRVLLTDSERKLLFDKAKEQNKTVSDFIRYQIVNAPLIEIDIAGLRKFAAELEPIANQVDKIAKKVRTNKKVEKTDIDELAAMMTEVEAMVFYCRKELAEEWNL